MNEIQKNQTNKKIFQIKDAFFNNGLINLCNFLNEYSFEDLEFELQSDHLTLFYKNEEVYFEILHKFLKKEKIISFNKKNTRIFFNTNINEFTQTSKINIKNGGSNDSKNALIRVHIDNLKISQSELLKKEEKYKQDYENHDKEDFKIKKCYYDKSKKEIYVLSTIEEHIEKFASYLVKSDILTLNSSTHNFEDGHNTFHDMLKISKNYTIDKWDALIYWFGTKIQYYFNYAFFMYLNSADLNSLYILKENLQIKDEKAAFKDEDGALITTNTNIPFYEQLSEDKIFGKKFKYFYLSKSDEEFKLKFFMYLSSKIFHIETSYIKAQKKGKITKIKELLYEALQDTTFITYEEDGTFKKSLTEYTKAYQLIRLFTTINDNDLFVYLADILVTFGLSQGQKEVNINLQKWCKSFLEFKSLRKYYYATSLNILKNNSKPFGNNLFIFEKLYLKKIRKGENMDILEESKKIGEQIGDFASKKFDPTDKKGDKDLLFKIRNIKNSKQLLSFLKDVEFAFLKVYDSQSSKNYYLDTTKILLDESLMSNNWEAIRDYIAIFAIDKYKRVIYSKTNKK